MPSTKIVIMYSSRRLSDFLTAGVFTIANYTQFEKFNKSLKPNGL